MKQVDREAVKTLAIAVGVREAARRLGLNEDRVCQWSKRGQWFKNPPKPKTIAVQQGIVSTVSTASDALRSTLTERSNATKLGLSKAAAKAAEHLAESEPVTILKHSRAMKDVASTASVVHGWEAGSRDTGPFNPGAIQILSQRTYLNLGNDQPEA
jgi:hypothetical protein